MKQSNWGKISVGLVVSAVCLWLAFRHVSLRELTGRMAEIDWRWAIAGFGWYFVSLILRSKRWVVLLENRAKVIHSFWAQCIGFLVTNVFPLRLGEPARILVLSHQSRLPFFRVAASAIVERIQDVLSILCILILVLPWIDVPPFVIRSGIILGAITMGIVLALIVAATYQTRFRRFLLWLLERWNIHSGEHWILLWDEFVAGVRPVMHWRIGISSVIWSALTWVASICIYWSVLLAFVPQGRFIEASFAIVVLALAIAVPSSPGFIGVFQYAGQQALVIPFGNKYDPSTALAITMAAHIMNYLVTTVLGILGLWQSSHSFSKLLQSIRLQQDEIESDATGDGAGDNVNDRE